ncbi:hypothetical protein HF325_005777 [Metschnikowia pulcherrima]|uniref:CRAL-TRIO domain-containing protein n=1 Tax=Metschnikowia pulcherrima TaxID=27326 RepID=A0A8H7GMM6_9ASCO|nr:hypothetical protein HF325_005777 [Metschnikowia pulcherrima]
MPVLANRIWSLTEDNEIATKQVWAILLKQFGYDLDNFTFGDLEKDVNFVASNSPNTLPDLSPSSILSSLPPVSARTLDVFLALNGNADVLAGGLDDTVRVTQKESHSTLSKFKSPQLHQSFWGSMRNDSPDNELLRFVRARKFKPVPAVDMAAACMQWKSESHRVNKWVMEGDAPLAFSKEYPELMKAFEMGKVFFRGQDRHGGQICVIHVKDHFGSDCPEKDFEIFICLVIEYAKLTMRSYSKDIDGANILFDMSGFSLKNADLNAVRFLAKAFEANYPESLSCIWVHKAPWIFNAVWKIIKGWLDPVVASKIHFTKNTADLERFVEAKNIPKDLGGLDSYVPQYVQPTDENTAVLPADEKSAKLLAERKHLVGAFIDATIAWINAKTKEESTKLLKAKIQLGGELANNYVLLDPYIRSRGPYDRDGTLPKISI